MFYKKVILNIYCSKNPCELTILSNKCKVIKKLTLNSKNFKHCFCTKDKLIKIKAKYEWLKRQYNALYDEDIDARAPGKIYI